MTAVKALTLQVERGALHGLIGPNGAGKTTVFNLLTGVYDATDGEMLFEGARIDGRKPYEITRLGIARTFQNIRLFPDLSVLENVMTARHLRSRQTLADAILGRRVITRRNARSGHDRWRCSRFSISSTWPTRRPPAPHGSQRRLEIARAPATDPRLLLLDEPAAGMNPQEALDLMRVIRRLRDEFALTILLVEHNMKVVMGVCETVHVIDYGETIAIGPPADIQRNPKVIERTSAAPEADDRC